MNVKLKITSVKLGDFDVTIDCDASIDDLKQEIERIKNIPPIHQLLIYSNSFQLQSGKTLKDYQIVRVANQLKELNIPGPLIQLTMTLNTSLLLDGYIRCTEKHLNVVIPNAIKNILKHMFPLFAKDGILIVNENETKTLTDNYNYQYEFERVIISEGATLIPQIAGGLYIQSFSEFTIKKNAKIDLSGCPGAGGDLNIECIEMNLFGAIVSNGQGTVGGNVSREGHRGGNIHILCDEMSMGNNSRITVKGAPGGRYYEGTLVRPGWIFIKTSNKMKAIRKQEPMTSKDI